jgi:predicted porin
MTTAETATDAATLGTAANTSIEALGDKVANSIHYLSPNINGFQGQLQYGMGEATTQATKGNADLTAFAITYAAGPLKAVVASAKQKRKGATVTYGDIRQSGYGLQYDAGFAKFGIAAISQDRDTRSAGNTTTGTVVTASAPIGNGISVFGALHTVKVDGVSETSSSATVIGLNKELSKRTLVYASYANTSNDASASYNITGQSAATASNGYDPKALSLGIRHLF